jgi:hypothetical protein
MICYFIDYCHPIEKVNKLIADEIAEIILGKKSGEFVLDKPTHKIKEKQGMLLDKIPLPTTHYTLY